MIETMWEKIIGGVAVFFFSTFIGTIIGTKVTLTRNREKIDALDEKIDSLEKLITTKFDYLEKSSQQQALSMGREIGDLKQEVKTIRNDVYDAKIRRK